MGRRNLKSLKTNQGITMLTYIKGTMPRDLTKYYEFAEKRRNALLTFNRLEIMSLYKQYDIEFPPKGESFWEAVAKNVLNMADAPTEARMEALNILNELNISYEEWIIGDRDCE